VSVLKVIGLKNSRHFFIQSELKPKTVATRLDLFCDTQLKTTAGFQLPHLYPDLILNHIVLACTVLGTAACYLPTGSAQQEAQYS